MFIINIIPIYVVLMVLIRMSTLILSCFLSLGRYSHRLYIAYSTFYILGSILAMQIPFVGFNVVKQAECILSHGVFIGLQCMMMMIDNEDNEEEETSLILINRLCSAGIRL